MKFMAKKYAFRLYPDPASLKNCKRLDVTVFVAVNPTIMHRMMPTFNGYLGIKEFRSENKVCGLYMKYICPSAGCQLTGLVG